MLELKKIFVFFTLFSVLNSVEVYVAKERIGYKQKITKELLTKKNINKIKKWCNPITKDILNQNYYAKHIILKNSVICKNDIKKLKVNKIVFNFGSIVIEKEGKILKETDRYIRFKNRDGKIETIYKQ